MDVSPKEDWCCRQDVAFTLKNHLILLSYMCLCVCLCLCMFAHMYTVVHSGQKREPDLLKLESQAIVNCLAEVESSEGAGCGLNHQAVSPGPIYLLLNLCLCRHFLGAQLKPERWE